MTVLCPPPPTAAVVRRSRLRRVKRCVYKRCHAAFLAGRGVTECTPWGPTVERFCSTACLDRDLCPAATPIPGGVAA